MIDLSANKPHDHSFGNIDNVSIVDAHTRMCGCTHPPRVHAHT